MSQYLPKSQPDPLPDWMTEDTTMTEQQLIEAELDRPRPSRPAKIAMAGLFLALVFAFCMSVAHAQTACTAGGSTTCFVASTTTGPSPIATTLTWNVIGASSCTAAGAAAWSGSVAPSGSKALSGVTVKMTLTLDCVAPATAGKMRLSWTPPTQNTDGTALTDLGGYVIQYGTAAGALTQTINLAVPGANTFDVTGLTAGTWFAAITAATVGCFPSTTVTCHTSVQSNVTSKAVTTTPGGNLPQLSVVLDPYTVPKPPTNVTASDPTAFEIKPNSAGTLVATRVGTVPVGTRCYDEQRIAAGVAYNGVPIALVDLINWPSVNNLTEAWAKCGA